MEQGSQYLYGEEAEGGSIYQQTALPLSLNSTFDVNQTLLDACALGDDDYVMPARDSLVPPITALISIVSSYVLLREVYVDHCNFRARGKPMKRVLAMMSVADIFYSLGLGFSTFLSPSELGYLQYNYGTEQVSGCKLNLHMLTDILLTLCFYLSSTYRPALFKVSSFSWERCRPIYLATW